MTVRAIVGLVVLNLAILGFGTVLVWGLTGWRRPAQLARLAGLSYLLGLAALEILATVLLVLGVPFTPATVALTCSSVSLAIVAARRLVSPDVAFVGWTPRRPPQLSVVGALYAAGIVVSLEALFRSLRLAETYDWDAWFTWMRKAKVLYVQQGLEDWIFGTTTTIGQAYSGYPPGFPALQALSFHAMGGVDVVTVNLLYWFFTVGFAAAAIGILVQRVRHEVALAFVLLALVLPGFTGIPIPGGAERPLAFFVAIAALLVVLWLREQQAWQLWAAAVLLAGAMLTKREGLLFAACVLAAAFAASLPGWRIAWTRLGGTMAVAVALALPWRAWVVSSGLPSDAPDAGYTGVFDHLDRVGPSLWIAVRAFAHHERWLVLPVVVAVAVAVGLLGRARREAVFLGAFVVLVVFGSAWVTVTNPTLGLTLDYGLNPATRYMVTPALLAAVVLPVLLTRAWPDVNPWLRRTAGRLAATPPLRAGVVAPWAIVIVAALAYPGSMLTGFDGLRLPGGTPPFPSAEECSDTPAPGRRARLVVGYASSWAAASALERRARIAGFAPTTVEHDGCGRLRVSLRRPVSVEVGLRLVERARVAELDAALERYAEPRAFTSTRSGRPDPSTTAVR